MSAADETTLVVREATEEDLAVVRELFMAVYGESYPYQGFYDEWWLKRSVYTDEILMLVAEDPATGRPVGTASVVLDIGAHSDLVGEFGRLVVDPNARGRGVGKLLMAKRVELVESRLHVGLVENRTCHPYSQRISEAHGFSPVGFLPLKHLFARRESIALYARLFGQALTLRSNHPRVVPEIHVLAHMAMENCGIPCDVIVDEVSHSYPLHADDYHLEELTARGVPALLRIERGRVRNREVFGPIRLHYGLFRLMARQATYLVAHAGAEAAGPVAGALGYIRDEAERGVRVFEQIAPTDEAVRFLWEQLLERCAGWETEYVEVDVSANAPRLQRTLIELGFLPAAYVPALAFHDVERVDVVKMVRLLVPPELGEVELTPQVQRLADHVMRGFTRQAVLPQIAQAIPSLTIFDTLNQEQASRVASVCVLETFAPGESLFTENQPADRMFVITRGNVRISSGERAVGKVAAGESLGEVSLLTREAHSASAAAEDEVVVGSLSRSAVEELARQRPDIGVVLYRNLAIGLGRKLQRADGSIRATRAFTRQPQEETPP